MLYVLYKILYRNSVVIIIVIDQIWNKLKNLCKNHNIRTCIKYVLVNARFCKFSELFQI